MLKTVLGKLKSLHLFAALTFKMKYAVKNSKFSTFLTEFSTLSRKSLYKIKTVVKNFALRRFLLKSLKKPQISFKKCISSKALSSTFSAFSVAVFVLFFFEQRKGFINERVREKRLVKIMPLDAAHCGNEEQDADHGADLGPKNEIIGTHGQPAYVEMRIQNDIDRIFNEPRH